MDLDPIFLHAVRYSGPDWSYQARRERSFSACLASSSVVIWLRMTHSFSLVFLQAPLPPWAMEVLASGRSAAAPGKGGSGGAAACEGATSAAGAAGDPAAALRASEDGALLHWPEGLWADVPQEVLVKYAKLLPEDERPGGGRC